jgi:hypothetical protein
MGELTFVGRTNWRDRTRPFGILTPDRRAHMYVVGATGTGKTSLLELLIRQDLVHGAGLALFDPHGDLAERVLAWMPAERKADVIYLDVPDPAATFTFNPLANVPPLRRSVTANGIVEALKKLFADSWGIRLEFILRSALLLLLDQPAATIADVSRLFHDPEFRKAAAERATTPQVRQFWTKEFEAYPGRFRAEAISPIENKLGSFLIDPFVSRILTSRVLVVNLAKGKIGESPAALFGSLLLSSIAQVGLARAESVEETRRDFYVYLDEFQTFTTLALATMMAELRKYRVPIIAANQFLEQVPADVRTSILANAGTLTVFRVGASDAAKLAKELGWDIEPVDLTFLPNRSFWIRTLVRGQMIGAFTGETITLKTGRESSRQG